jgi:hypothetical protein
MVDVSTASRINSSPDYIFCPITSDTVNLRLQVGLRVCPNKERGSVATTRGSCGAGSSRTGNVHVAGVVGLKGVDVHTRKLISFKDMAAWLRCDHQKLTW